MYKFLTIVFCEGEKPWMNELFGVSLWQIKEKNNGRNQKHIVYGSPIQDGDTVEPRRTGRGICRTLSIHDAGGVQRQLQSWRPACRTDNACGGDDERGTLEYQLLRASARADDGNARG